MLSLTFYYDNIPAVLCILAGVIYGIRIKQLRSFERLILVILVANILTDVATYLVIHAGKQTHAYYNVLLPAERTITLLIYAFNEHGLRRKRIHYAGMAIVCLSYFWETVYSGNIADFHDVSNVVSGLVVAVLSYVHLRSVALNTAGQSIILFWFGLANLIYFTMMISAMSALPLALEIDNDFASDIYNINIAAYALWSIVLIVGILWKKQKI